ncbi:gliding motility-associated C-terminal domain-containing protein [uncultured Kordia sp.]|uniref:T9SS type B sorting domain-containing protein n=1 Tax=uncultured Kordia sp. TaxID=507699 RepID=UPI0026133AC7|nr:gliding motility-associated C-terminal domain-containing protein [uncultured Kordia sp.]
MNRLFYLFFLLISTTLWSQTTDLSVSIEVVDTNGNTIPNVFLFQEFSYIATVSNSGNTVSNATFSQQLHPNITFVSVLSINPLGGASMASNLAFDNGTDTITGMIPNMPTNSSVQIQINVRAPISLGGISTTAEVFPPTGTTDTMPDSNIAIISMDVNNIPIDFSVDYEQVSPSSGTGITAWGDQVTFEVTITNNSAIEYPISEFSLSQSIQSDAIYGTALVQLISVSCIDATNGVQCPSNLGLTTGNPSVVIPTTALYLYENPIIFPSQSSLTFSVTYAYFEGNCGEVPGLIVGRSFASIGFEDQSLNGVNSNIELTDLLFASLCPCTDVSIFTVKTDPPGSAIISDFNQTVTYETTVTNNGPLDTTILFYLQNLGYPWEILSVECISATGGLNCGDVVYNTMPAQQFWEVNNFFIPSGAQIVTRTVVRYNEPICPTDMIVPSTYRSTINMLEHIDCNPDDNNEFGNVFLPIAMGTDECVDALDFTLTKTQVAPVLPLGGSANEPIPWGNITYHITATNNNLVTIPLTMSDYYGAPPTNQIHEVTAILQSVNCIETTGTADCITVTNANIGIAYTNEDAIFWEITADENWELPAESSVTFEVVVNWTPECSSDVTRVTNSVTSSVIDLDITKVASANSYLTPCVDLIIQTFPSSPTVPINTNFEWIVDITNSVVSSTATDAVFSTIVNNAFTITGTPTCTITNGNATCISTFNINGNTIDGIIPLLDPEARIQVRIPVTAPNFGGSFNNSAEVQPDPANNGEFDPSTNISISSVQVISPQVEKSFVPDEILETQTSLLTFTVSNIPGNTAQSGISFTDNLPNGIVLAGNPYWVNSNGCTADFVGLVNDDFVGITNLVFPDGAAECTFAVLVTSNTSDLYTNEFTNFSNLNNIDATNAFATLNVLPLPPSADLEISLISNQTDYCEGDEITFTLSITNNGPDDVGNVSVTQFLNPLGFTYISDNANGTYTNATGIWELPNISISAVAGNNTFSAEVVATILNVDVALTNQYESTAEITATSITDLDSDVTTSFDSDDLNDGLPDDDETTLQINVFEIHNDVDVMIDDVEICNGSSTTLSINNPNNLYTYNWYATSNPDQVIFTGTSFETPFITADTSYEIEVINQNNCPGISRALVNVTTVNCIDLGLEKTVDTPMPSIGETISFTITITNNSTDDATNIVIEELLPNGYEYVSHTTTLGLYDSNTQLWSISNLPAESSATLSLTVTVIKGDDYQNIVQIISQAEIDLDDANNTAQAITLPDCLEIPSGFSPNNDNVNDVWEIACLENFSDNELIIFNRWGTVIYKARNYANDWNGTSNQGTVIFKKDERLPVGTYFYILKLQGNTVKKTGWVYINY